MKCAAVNKNLRKKRMFETGKDAAIKKMSLFLDSVLSDKLGYSNTRIKQIHTSFNKVASDVTQGRRSIGEITEFLKTEYGVELIGLEHENRIRPAWFRSDYVGGVYASSDALSIVLIYVLVHMYRFSEEKCNRVIKGINNVASSVNLGYITEDEIKGCLYDEEGLVVEKLGEVVR